MADELTFKVVQDFGAFGDGKWQKHLALVKWGDNDPKYDIRPWNDDMTKMGKGITLTDSEALDLMDLLEIAFGMDDGEDDESIEEIEDDDYDSEDLEEDEEDDYYHEGGQLR